MRTIKHGQWTLTFDPDFSGDAQLEELVEGDTMGTTFPAELLKMAATGGVPDPSLTERIRELEGIIAGK